MSEADDIIIDAGPDERQADGFGLTGIDPLNLTTDPFETEHLSRRSSITSVVVMYPWSDKVSHPSGIRVAGTSHIRTYAAVAPTSGKHDVREHALREVREFVEPEVRDLATLPVIFVRLMLEVSEANSRS